VSEEDKREKIRGKKEKITQRRRVNRDSQRMRRWRENRNRR
jgi:hypothetical protein